jgi:hypothetical protein
MGGMAASFSPMAPVPHHLPSPDMRAAGLYSEEGCLLLPGHLEVEDLVLEEAPAVSATSVGMAKQLRMAVGRIHSSSYYDGESATSRV